MVILKDQCLMELRGPGFAQLHRAADNGALPTNLMKAPTAEVCWAIPWQVHPRCCLTCLYSMAEPTLKLASNFCLGRAKLQSFSAYML